MLITIGSFIEIGEEYFRKFKTHIESYENSIGNEEAISEKEQIKNEFVSGKTNIGIIDNLMSEYSGKLTQRLIDIHNEHKKKINKVERKNKRKIKMAKTLLVVGSVFYSDKLLNLSEKKLEEVKEARRLLEKELDLNWQKSEYFSKKADTIFQPILNDAIEEVIIATKMNTADLESRRTNEELENVLGEQLLCEAIQDKHGIGIIFKKMVDKFSKKNEREDR